MKRTILALIAIALPLSASTVDVITNGGFEAPQIATNDYCYLGAVVPGHTCSTPYTDWTGAYEEGNGNNAFGSTFHTGTQALILQGSSNALQTFDTGTGAFTLTWFDENRSGYPESAYQVLVDNVVLGTYNPPAAWGEQTLTGTFAEGGHSLQFQGISTQGVDSTVFIDDVSLLTQPTPEPGAIFLILGGVSLIGAGRFSRKSRR